MKTSLKMFAMNLAISNIVEIIGDCETLDDLLDGIDYAMHITYRDMEHWIDVNTTQFIIEEIEARTYSRFISDVTYYYMYKNNNPSLAQTDISDFSSIVRDIYDL